MLRAMRTLSLLMKPVSRACNMACAYCFYEDVSQRRACPDRGVMDQSTMEALVERVILSSAEPLTIRFAFQGGEPTLAGYGFFRRFVEVVDRLNQGFHEVSWSLQTNGLDIPDELLDLFRERDFLLGVSIDGPSAIHDALRPDRKGSPTSARVMETIARIRERGIRFNILTVLTKELCAHPEELLDFYRENGFLHAQIIPCLPPLDQDGPFTPDPEEFAAFYDRLFRRWIATCADGTPRISLLDELIRLMRGDAPLMCGSLGRCSMQYVVEADGSVYPCDFYALDGYELGSIRDSSLERLTERARSGFLACPRRLDPVCIECPYLGICGGNCKRMATVLRKEGFCGLRAFLDAHAEELLRMAGR